MVVHNKGDKKTCALCKGEGTVNKNPAIIIRSLDYDESQNNKRFEAELAGMLRYHICVTYDMDLHEAGEIALGMTNMADAIRHIVKLKVQGRGKKEKTDADKDTEIQSEAKA